MAWASKSLSGKIFDQGWVASIVVGILLLSLTNTSLWGIVFALLSMLVLLVTFCKFSGSPSMDPIGVPLNRMACRTGYFVGVFCLACSLYWTFRLPLAEAMPTYTVEFVNDQLQTAEISGMAKVLEMPTIEGIEADSIFGLKNSNNFKVAGAHELSKLIVNGTLSHVDYTTKVAGTIFIAMFFVMLLIHAFAQYVWQAIASVRDGAAR